MGKPVTKPAGPMLEVVDVSGSRVPCEIAGASTAREAKDRISVALGVAVCQVQLVTQAGTILQDADLLPTSEASVTANVVESLSADFKYVANPNKSYGHSYKVKVRPCDEESFRRFWGQAEGPNDQGPPFRPSEITDITVEAIVRELDEYGTARALQKEPEEARRLRRLLEATKACSSGTALSFTLREEELYSDCRSLHHHIFVAEHHLQLTHLHIDDFPDSSDSD